MDAEDRRRRRSARGADERRRGKAQEVKGRAKEKLGRATGDPRLQAEGRADRQAGSLKQAVQKVKDAFRRS